MQKQLIVIAILLVVVYACKHQVNQPSAGSGGGTSGGGTGTGSTAICFEAEVLPIFTSNCAKSGCHDVASHQEDLVFNSYNGIRFGKHEAIVPGKPAESKIYKMITETDPRKRMPLGFPELSLADKNLIKKWIEEGANNTTNCGTACNPAIFTYSGAVRPIIEKNCIGCHNITATATQPSFTDYNGVKAVAQPNGRLLGAINHKAGFSPMPKSNPQIKLSDCQINQITQWVQSGAPNN